MDALINERVSAPPGFGKSRGPARIELISAHVREFLNLRRLPARLTVQQTAALLNCGEHDIAVLVSHGVLKPLGNPPPNAVKYFGPTDVLELAGDSKCMGQICNIGYRHWREKNAAKSKRARNGRSAANGAGVPQHQRNGVKEPGH